MLYSEEQVVYVLYTNWEGKTAWRRVIPFQMPPQFRSTSWHPEPQWLLLVWDLDKKAERSYAIKDIHRWVPQKDFTEEIKNAFIEETQRGISDASSPSSQGTNLTPQG